MEIKTPPKIHTYANGICRAWYNGSYIMATKPIKFLELHYTAIQFLIMIDSSRIYSIYSFKKIYLRVFACDVTALSARCYVTH